jgi:glycosyltransferase involved in cell wall biosynthesis
VIFEAWDAGAVPVACITSAGAAEVIAAADGGILYAEQAPESLARALQAALRLPQEEVARLIGNGRSWMSKHCDPRSYNKALAKILCDAGYEMSSKV